MFGVRPLIFAVGYLLCATVSGFLTHWTNAVSYVWLPSGLYLGALLISSPREWPAYILASAVSDQIYNAMWDPWPVSITLVAHTGNTISAVLGAWLVRRYVTERPSIMSVRELLGIVGLAGIVGLVPTALCGAKMVELTSPNSDYVSSFVTWYTSDLLGVILVTPTIVVWQTGVKRFSDWNLTKRGLEYVALIGLSAIATGSAFYFGWLRQTETLYVAFPFMIWAAVRFGLRGTTVAILLTAIGAETFTALGYGALGASSMSSAQKSIEIMVSLGVFAVVGLLPATIFSALARAQSREKLRTRTMTLIATGAKLPEILDSIATAVEAENPAMLCSILLVDPAGVHLRIAAGPSLPAYFNEQIDGLAVSPGNFACGAAAYSNSLVIIKDLRHDPRTSTYLELAERVGIRACWSQPFSDSHGRVLGTFAVYYREAHSPTESELALITAASHLAAIATERKQLEEQFLRAQRMEGIGTLAGGIAHDLNNVFTPIVMGAELLREEPLEPDGRRVLANIEASARRGANLVRQVLTFARGVEGSRETLSLETVFAGFETLAGNSFPKNIEVTRHIAPNLPSIRGDRTQIEQVFFNLCVNARDAMPEGGTLRISAHARRVEDQQARSHPGVVAGEFVEIEVADTGLGMTPEMMNRIFEPFYTTKKLGQGTGLGLSTALGIVRSHGGFMEVTSSPGNGSAFRVYFPVVPEEAPSPNGAEPRTLVRGRGELILVVDDETAIRQMATQALSKLGYTVIHAENGAEGLSRVEKHRDELAAIVTDIMMPVMDGHEFIGRLEKIAPEIPVITASGFDAGAKPAAVSSPNRPHLPKPYTIESLSDRLATVLKK